MGSVNPSLRITRIYHCGSVTDKDPSTDARFVGILFTAGWQQKYIPDAAEKPMVFEMIVLWRMVTRMDKVRVLVLTQTMAEEMKARLQSEWRSKIKGT